MTEYSGYKLIDEVLIICRPHLPGEDIDYYKAYIVDPDNKQQCSNARRWARITYYGDYDEATSSYPDKRTLEPIEFKQKNTGFDFELLECATDSSVGGKLSFWNCLVTKDDIKVSIAVNTEMLLTLLKEGTFIKGRCQEKVCFASHQGRSGVLIENGVSYNAAKADVALKADISKSLTSKYESGAHLKTLTLDEYYLGEFYIHYKLKDRRGYGYYRSYYSEVSLVKLKTPKKVHVYCTYPKGKTRFSDCLPVESSYWWADVRNRRSKRVVESDGLVMDITHEDFVKKLSELYAFHPHEIRSDIDQAIYICKSRGFGIGDKEAYEVDSKILELFKSYGVKIIEE